MIRILFVIHAISIPLLIVALSVYILSWTKVYEDMGNEHSMSLLRMNAQTFQHLTEIGEGFNFYVNQKDVPKFLANCLRLYIYCGYTESYFKRMYGNWIFLYYNPSNRKIHSPWDNIFDPELGRGFPFMFCVDGKPDFNVETYFLED